MPPTSFTPLLGLLDIDEPVAELPPLDIDPWLASSLLQKAIRRGEADLAERAAVTLWRHRGPSIWRRFVVIGVEDIGLGSISTVVDTVTIARAMTSTSRRHPMLDPLRALRGVARALAEAPKDRSTDYLISNAVHDPCLEWFRSECFRLPVSGRIAAAADQALPLNLRAVAAWTVSSFNVDGAPRLDGGDRPGFFRACRDAGLPGDLADAMTAAAILTREPICMMLPPLWMDWKAEGRSSRVTVEEVPAAPTVASVPLWTLDKHTRSGKQAIGRLVTENHAVREVIVGLVGVRRAKDAAAMAAFFLDASPVDRRLDWPSSRHLETEGRRVDMGTVGVPWDGVEPVLDVMRANYDHLNELRAEALRKSMAAGAGSNRR